MQKEKIITVTFKISAPLNQKINEKIIADGYGMHGKSKWLREAIEKLFIIPNYPELVSLAGDMENVICSISIRIPEQLFLEIEKAIVPIRKLSPNLEGVKSKILRTAALQRLIRW
jgi:hypothetical protein